jgi:DNA-binding response OmpR family regulator
MLERNEYDVIITDIHMPYHNGDEIIDFVRCRQKRNTPIIMLSSDREEEIIVLARKQGVNIFLKKPVKADVLIKSIRSLVSK